MARILVVDDDNLFRTVIMETLEICGHVCFGAHTVADAKAWLAAESYELILSDYHMPGATGLELLNHVVAQYPETRFIMVSAADGMETKEEALQLGADGYLSKPFKMEELLKAIGTALAGKGAYSRVSSWRRSFSGIRALDWCPAVLHPSV